MKEREKDGELGEKTLTSSSSLYFQIVTPSVSCWDARPVLHSHILEIHINFNLFSSFSLHNVVINLNVQSSDISSTVLYNKVALVSVSIYGNSVS